MSSDTITRNAVRDSARVVATELLREPVKQAVREALREEAMGVSPGDREATGTASQSSDGSGSSGGGRSRILLGVLLIGLAGVAYMARRRMRSNQQSWTGPGSEEDGYTTEGEIQSTEGAGESENVDHSEQATEQ